MDDELDLFEVAVRASPRWITGDHQAREFLHAAAKIMAPVLAMARHWLVKQTMIEKSTGPTAEEPDWLDEHARDRGTRRQDGETDAALRARIRNIQDAVTRPALVRAADEVVGEEGSVILHLRRVCAYFGSVQPMTGTGGTLTAPDDEGRQRFLPDVAFPAPPLRSTPAPPPREYRLAIDGFDPANDGEHTVVALDGDAAVIYNPDGEADEVPAGTWEVRTYDQDENRRDGHPRAYMGRGYRMSGHRKRIVLLVPEHVSDGVVASLREMLRERAGATAGALALIENRPESP